MKNVTVSLADELVRQARILAASADTSMSQYLGRLIAEKIEADRQYDAAMRRFVVRKPRKLRASPSPYPARESLHDRDARR
jgi:hypothetical protein